MIATHSTKLTNGKAKQSAVCSEIIADVPSDIICSKNTPLVKRYFACPKNAADMRVWREKSAQANSGKVAVEKHLPDITDGRAVKQVLLPLKDWKNDEYLSVSPLASMGLMRELWLRAKEKGLKVDNHIIQAVPAAYSNHGELLLDQAGRLALLKRGVRKQEPSTAKFTGVVFSFYAQDMNIAGGLIAKGLPSITAMGGLVHLLERQTGQDIQFACGLESIKWNGRRRFGTYTSKAKPAVPSYTTESTGSGKVHLLLKCKDPIMLSQSLQENMPRRFAGGSLFEENIQVLDDETVPAASYLTAYKPQPKIAPLDAVLNSAKAEQEERYGEKGQDTELKAPTLLECGYGLLEQPKPREMARNGYSHAWAEPLFMAVEQSIFGEDCFFERKIQDGAVLWMANGQ